MSLVLGINPFPLRPPEYTEAAALLRNLVDALDNCDEVITGMTLRCYGANDSWDGPSYAKEREAARAYLQRLETE